MDTAPSCQSLEGMTMANDTIFLITADGSLERAPHSKYASEDLLQRLVQDHPDILVGEQIDPDNPPRWLLIQREAGIPDREGGSDRWSIDHLLLDQHGRPTFVEVKRSSDTRIRREVVGQMLDYAANAQVYWPEDRIRAMAAATCGSLEALENRLREFLGSSDMDDEVDIEGYWDSVERHLRNGEVRLLFVADSIPTELRRIIEFLNEHMPLIEVLGVEIRQYEGPNIRALVPRVIGQTESARQQKSSARPTRKTTREAFLEACTERSRAFYIDCFDLAAREGYSVIWGTKGFSLRLQTETGGYRSIFYGYPSSGDGQGPPLFHAYLGYLRSDEISEALRKAFSERLPFLAKGKHTMEIVVTEKNSEELRKALRGLLELGREYAMRDE
jgi:hypothetical protein